MGSMADCNVNVNAEIILFGENDLSRWFAFLFSKALNVTSVSRGNCFRSSKFMTSSWMAVVVVYVEKK